MNKKRKNNDISIIFIWSIPILVSLVVSIIVGVTCKIVKNPDAIKLAEQSQQIKMLKDELDKKSNQYSDMQSLTKTVDDLNIYTGDVDENDAIASDFFSHFCTYSDGEQYEKLRNELMNDYGYTKDSTVLNCFLPEQDITYDSKGHIQYEVDLTLQNMEFESLESYRIYVDGGVSYYAGIVHLLTEDWSGDSVGNNVYGANAYVTYSVVNDEIQDVEAYALKN